MSEKRKVLKSAGVVGAFTLLSRVTGLVRDSVLAAMFGASRLADTFNNAFELVNQVRRVLGEGALSSFIVPVLSERRVEQGAAGGWELFNRIANFMLVLAMGITLVGGFFSREVYMLFGGLGQLAHGETEYIDMGARMTRLMFPYVIGLTLAALMMGACHTLKSFTAPSLGSVMLNLTMILAGAAALLLHKRVGVDRAAIWLCWAVLAGAALRVVIMVPPMWKAGWRWQPNLNLADPGLRRLLWMMGLALLGMSLSQINVAVSSYFANYLGAGVKVYITYANRLLQFPMALTATAVATALLPQLSLYHQEGRGAEMRDMMAFIKRLEIVFMAPAMLGLMIFGLPILQLIFEHGKFTASATRGTYWALMAYAPGLVALGWIRLLQPLYYARKDLMTPLKAGVVSVVLNLFLNWLFAFHTGWAQAGLGAANTLASFANYAVLAWYMRRELAARPGEYPRIGETLWKSLLASLVACALGAGLYWVLLRWLGSPEGILSQGLMLLPTIALVGVIYFALIHRLGTPDSDRAVAMLLKKIRPNR